MLFRVDVLAIKLLSNFLHIITLTSKKKTHLLFLMFIFFIDSVLIFLYGMFQGRERLGDNPLFVLINAPGAWLYEIDALCHMSS